MFKAIGRYFRALGYLLTGRVNRASETLSENPDVMAATYDKIITDKKERINQFKNAISKMVAIQENKKEKLKSLSQDIAKLEKLKAGALQVAQAKAHELGSKEACAADAEYIKCQKAFSDFNSTLSEKRQHADELEDDIQQSIKDIEEHKNLIKDIIRDLEKIKSEKHDAIADVISAKEQQSLADMMNGLSEDRSDEELSELRQMRQNIKAKAKVSRELSDLDSKNDEKEFLDALKESEAANEFDALINFDKEEPSSSEKEKKVDISLPES